MDYQRYYRTLFETFGYPLGQNASVADSSLATASRSLGVVIPLALGGYYSVAGREKRLNRSHNHLLTIGDWHIDKKRLVFMVENQAVVVWGVSISDPKNDDPPVFQSVNDYEYQWAQESCRCSTFLAVALHYQAVCGGFKHCGSCPATHGVNRRLKSGWTYHGTSNRMTAHSRKNQVVCVEPEQGVLAGGKTKQDLFEIETELRLKLDRY